MGNGIIRAFIGAIVAVPVAFGLFFLMQSLIDKEYEQEDIDSRKIADIVVPEREIDINTKEVKPEKVEDPEEPPPDLSTPAWMLPTSRPTRVSRLKSAAAGCPAATASTCRS